MRIMGSYAVVLILHGQGRYTDGLGNDQSLSAGELILLFPDIPHHYAPAPGRTWLESYIVFDSPVFDLWRQGGMLDPRKPVWKLSPIEYWDRRFNAILGVDRPDRFTNHRICDEDEPAMLQRLCLLQQFLADAAAHQQRATDHDRAQWLAEAKTHIERSMANPAPDWNHIADQMTISPETFRKRFAQLAGLPPAKYRIARLMDSACNLLQHHPDTKLRAIAASLGFCDEFHFSRRFKQVVGLSPTDFRRQIGAPPLK